MPENNKSSKRAFQALVTLINLTYYYFDKDKAVSGMLQVFCVFLNIGPTTAF